MARALGRHLCALVIPVLAMLISCASNVQPVWIEAAGIGIKPPWRPPREGRARAMAVAEAKARVDLWDSLKREKIDANLTIEQLAVENSIFRSRLYGMIGTLKAKDVSESTEGLVVVEMQIDKQKVMRLARKYVPRASARTE